MRSFFVVCLVFMLLFVGPSFFSNLRSEAGTQAPLQAPELTACKALPEAHDSGWRPLIHGADKTVMRSYSCDDYRVHLHLSQFFVQEQGREAVNAYNKILNADWIGVRPAPQTLTIGSEQLKALALLRGSRSWTVWSWYCSGARMTASRTRAKLLEIFDAMLLRKSHGCVVAVAFERDYMKSDASDGGVVENVTRQVWNDLARQLDQRAVIARETTTSEAGL